MKYFFVNDRVKKEVKDKDLIQRICKAKDYKLRTLVGAYFIKLDECIYGIREFDVITLLDEIDTEKDRIINEIMKFNGKTFEEIEVSKEGQYSFIL